MRKPVFEGVATALVTPFRQGTIDYPSLDRLLDLQLAAKIPAIVVCGTTGEASTLSDKEKRSLISHCVQYVSGQCLIIAGTGTNDTAHSLELSRVAASSGADGVLCVTPYYNKCTQDGLVKHYYAIADQIDIPLIVYNVPSRTGMHIEPSTYAVLAEHPNINGVKEADSSLSAAAQTIACCPEDFYLWSGNDDLTLPLMAMGAKGVISVVSNVKPAEMSQLTCACLHSDLHQAMVLQKMLQPWMNALFCEVNPIPVKYALSAMGYISEELRLPLTALSEANHTLLNRLISEK